MIPRFSAESAEWFGTGGRHRVTNCEKADSHLVDGDVSWRWARVRLMPTCSWCIVRGTAAAMIRSARRPPVATSLDGWFLPWRFGRRKIRAHRIRLLWSSPGRVGRLSLFALLVGQCDGGGGAGKGGGPVVVDGALGYVMRGGDLMVGGVGPRRPARSSALRGGCCPRHRWSAR